MTEIQYLSLSLFTQEVLWVRTMLRILVTSKWELRRFGKTIKAQSHWPAAQAVTPHVDVRHHFVREIVAQNTVIVKYVSTVDQLAVIVKALRPKRFIYSLHASGISPRRVQH